jgi:hypothetical protein
MFSLLFLFRLVAKEMGAVVVQTFADDLHLGGAHHTVSSCIYALCLKPPAWMRYSRHASSLATSQ